MATPLWPGGHTPCTFQVKGQIQTMHDELTENMQEGHDYMSDTFLKELEDVRPGLLNREAKRKARVSLIKLVSMQGVERSRPTS